MDTRHRLMKNLPLAGGGLVVLVLVVSMVWWIRGFLLTKNNKPARVVQNITVIRPLPGGYHRTMRIAIHIDHATDAAGNIIPSPGAPPAAAPSVATESAVN